MKDQLSEKLLLAGLIKNGAEVFFDVDTMIGGEDFTLPEYRLIYAGISKAIKAGITVLDDNILLQKIQAIDAAAATRYEVLSVIEELRDHAVSVENIDSLTKNVARAGVIRNLITRLTDTEQYLKNVDLDQPIMNVMSEVEKRVFDFASKILSNEQETVNLADEIDGFVNFLAENKPKRQGIPTGFRIYDQAIGGGLRSGVHIIGARPKCFAAGTRLSSIIDNVFQWINIEDVVKEANPARLIYNGWKYESPTEYIHFTDKHPMLTVRCGSGVALTVTIDHEFLVVNKDKTDFDVKEAKDLLVGDSLPVNHFNYPKQIPITSIESVEPAESYCVTMPFSTVMAENLLVKNCGKTTMAINISNNISSLGVPVLYLDTEMTAKDVMTKSLASMTRTKISAIENGSFADNMKAAKNIEEGVAKLKSRDFHYHNVAGYSPLQMISVIRKWLNQKVGFDDDGNLKPCVVILDYLKMMDLSQLKNLQEYQALGQTITDLHNLTRKYDFPILTFVQLNRDGIDKENSGAVSGSDRLIWLCTSFTIFKKKTIEDFVADPITNGDRKLVISEVRYGPGLMDGEYINIISDLSCGVFEEGETNLQNRSNRGSGITQPAPQQSKPKVPWTQQGKVAETINDDIDL